jgi:predicted transposase YdaD
VAAGRGELNLTPWQLNEVQKAIEQLEEERFAEGERTMSEAERPDLYEQDGYVAGEPIERQRLVDQLAAAVAKILREPQSKPAFLVAVCVKRI